MKPASLSQLLSLAWPIMISRSTQAVVTICDALMVASLGPAALGAASTGGFNTFTFLIFPMGTVFIVSSFASQYFGQGDLVSARRYGWYGLMVALLTELAVLALRPFLPELLSWFAYEPEVHALMLSYIEVRMLTAGAAIGLEALGGYFGGIGNTRLPMLASIFAMSINVLLCWLFIGGHWGAPAMGVKGAALGNAIATGLAFVALFSVFLLGGKSAVGPREARRLRVSEFAKLLRFGLPSGFNWLFEFLAFSFFINVVVTSLGTSSLAAVMSVFDLNTVAFMPAFGLSSAGAIIVGQQIGANAKDLVAHTLRLTRRTTMTWQGIVGVLYIAIPSVILSFFIDGKSDTTVFMQVGSRTLFMAGLWQIADANATTYSEALRAAGDTAFTLWARIVLSWGVFVPGAYLSVRYFHTDFGASVWLLVYLVLLASTLVWRFNGGRWRSIGLTQPS